MWNQGRQLFGLMVALVCVAMLTTGCVGVRAGAGSLDVGMGVPIHADGSVDPLAGKVSGSVSDKLTGDRIISGAITINWPAAVMTAKRWVLQLLPDLGAIVGSATPTPSPPSLAMAPVTHLGSSAAARGSGVATGAVE